MNSPSATPGRYPNQNEGTWSKSEKAIARTAFDAALTRELEDVMQKAKQMANQIKDPEELWELERYLTERRKEIGRKYDYRYSQLDLVFGRLLREKWIDEKELCGLREDKLRAIRSYAKFFAGIDPAGPGSERKPDDDN